MWIQLTSKDGESFTIDFLLAQLSTRLRDVLMINPNLSINIPYLADVIELVLECMNELLTAPVNVANDYIFYQLVPLIEGIINDIGIIELLELTYIADYLEVDPLINVFAYMLSQYLLDPDDYTSTNDASNKINQVLADIAYTTKPDFVYNDLAPDVIKYISKHHFIAFAEYYSREAVAIKLHSTEEVEATRSDIIEYTIADLNC